MQHGWYLLRTGRPPQKPGYCAAQGTAPTGLGARLATGQNGQPSPDDGRRAQPDPRLLAP